MDDVLLDPSTGLFAWSDRDDGVEIYCTGLSWPILASFLDGVGVMPTWTPRPRMTRSETLFAALRTVTPTWTGFYVLEHDGAVGEIAWIRQIPSNQLDSKLLREFQIREAAQGGSAYLGLLGDSLDDLVLFTLEPQRFLVTAHGRFSRDLPDLLLGGAG